MSFSRLPSRRGTRDEGEKPFWISFADLMTALMVLFLVVMAVTLLAVTRSASEIQSQHDKQVSVCVDAAAKEARKHHGVTIEKEGGFAIIDFGDRARFGISEWSLTPEQELVLRQFVPGLLKIAQGPKCNSVLKRIVVEGYTDKTGTYLGNLDLSLRRSQSVLCAMFANEGPSPLNEAQKAAVRDYFLVGGYAYNSAKETLEESRRVEMRIEFLEPKENRVIQKVAGGVYGTCALR